MRLEDTDQTRLVDGTAGEIHDVLSWAGIKPDESPALGGPYGPYQQSARLQLYNQKAKELIESGQAYKCFCSSDRLTLLRSNQLKNREKPHYDRKCRHLSPSEIEEKLVENKGKHVVRFALEEGVTKFEDMIFGSISNNLIENRESDPIILKSDLFPTYHFANVVDDHHMKITHVLRGSEWISSTTKHIQLYQAFDWNVPNFAHFPLITLQDGTKLSKRNNQTNMQQLMKEGYRPLAILNFLTNIGGGVPKNKQDSMDLWDIERIVDEFDFHSIACHPASVDKGRLDIYNAKDLKKAWREKPEDLKTEITGILKQKGIASDLSEETLSTVIPLFIDRITTINDLFKSENLYIWQQPQITCSLEEYRNLDVKGIIEEIMKIVERDEVDDRSVMRDVAFRYEIAWPQLMKLIRIVLTDRQSGLPVYEIFECLGKKRLLQYLNKFLSSYR